jgi:hypothetical protein
MASRILRYSDARHVRRLSVRTGTQPFFGLHTPKKTVLRSMAMLVEKGSIRGTARAMGADKDSVALWLKRAGEHCEEVTEYLLRDLNLRRDKSTELPIFTSDDWDAYKNALVEVYGVEEQPEYKGRGRPLNPKKVPPPDLKYGQVVKYREGVKLPMSRRELYLATRKKCSVCSNWVETALTRLT